MPVRSLALAALMVGSVPQWALAASFTWSSASDALSMDPQAANDVVSTSVQGAIYEPLVGISPQLVPEPVLATRWERVGDDRWRFHLRAGVQFQDGRPFTADDVVFTAARGLADTADTRQELTSIREVVKVDDATVDILTKGPDPILPRELNFLRIMSKGWAEEHGSTKPADMRQREETFTTRHANGTGPYRLVTREPDSQTVLEPNTKWWNGKPALDKVTFRPLANDSTRVAALLSGAVDMTDAVPVQDVPRVEHTDGLRVVQGPETRVVYLGFDQTSPELPNSSVKGRNPFQDQKVRRAFYQAIDMDAIATKVLRNYATPVGTLVVPQVEGFSAEANRRFPYDPAAAQKLLGEAGYPDGFEIGMDCPNNRYMADASVCQAAVGMLARIGVKVTLATMPKAQFFPKLFQRKSSFWMFGWIPTTYDAEHVLINTMATRDPASNRGAFNHGGYSNPQVDSLISRAQVEFDPAARRGFIGEALALHAADVGHIPLYQQSLLWGMKRSVRMVQLPDGVVQIKWVRIEE